MKAVKILAIVLGVYVALVAVFESMIGILQPDSGNTLVITTTGGAGDTNDRVLARLESGGKLYVAANHWPRAWYNRALEEPDVEITFEGAKNAYRAVSITGEEHDRVNADNSTGLMFRVMTGFPPRKFVRLDPR